jgi:hypothetical protein
LTTASSVTVYVVLGERPVTAYERASEPSPPDGIDPGSTQTWYWVAPGTCVQLTTNPELVTDETPIVGAVDGDGEVGPPEVFCGAVLGGADERELAANE